MKNSMNSLISSFKHTISDGLKEAVKENSKTNVSDTSNEDTSSDSFSYEGMMNSIGLEIKRR